MFTVDSNGDGVNDAEENGVEPIGIPWRNRTYNVGTRIRRAIEVEADFEIKCVHCLNKLLSLNNRVPDEINIDEATDGLLVELQLPHHFHPEWKTANRRVWLRSIIESIVTAHARG